MTEKPLRKALELLFPRNAFVSNAWDQDRLAWMKSDLENAPTGPNQFIVLVKEVDIHGKKFKVQSQIRYRG